MTAPDAQTEATGDLRPVTVMLPATTRARIGRLASRNYTTHEEIVTVAIHTYLDRADRDHRIGRGVADQIANLIEALVEKGQRK